MGLTTGHELVNHIFPLHSPKNDEIGYQLDQIREDFMDLANTLVDVTTVSPEQTIAIRKTHEAMQAWVTAVVLYQIERS